MYKMKQRILNVDMTELKDTMLLQPKTPICRFLWGPEGVGKSEVVKAWLEEMDSNKLEENKVFYFWLDFKEIENTGKLGYWEIWKKLVLQFKETIPKEAYENEADTIEEVFELMDNSIEEILEEYDEDAKVCINELFEAFTSAEMHIKVIMNHFEEVIRIFPKETDDGWFFMQLFDLSPKGSLVEKNLSILLISDCYATKDMIHHMEYHSEFTDGYKAIYLGEYREKEMELYYEALTDEIGEISDNQKERIEYYCGRHPKMLEIMHDLLIKEDGIKNIDETVFKDYYKKLSQNLEKRKHLIEVESDETLFEYGYLFKDYNSGEYMALSEGFKQFL